MSKKLLLKFLMVKFHDSLNQKLLNLSFLLMRVATGLTMLFAHGIGKWNNFSNIAPNFPDPFGFLGSTFSLALVVGSELFGAALLVVGLLTRWASFSLLFTMLVAGFIIHGADPFAQKELAVVYAFLFCFFTLAGAGRYSLDHYLFNKKR